MTTQIKPVQRTMYAITGRSGQFLINLATDGPVFSPMAIEAIHTRHAWLSSTLAAAKLADVRQLFPGVPFNLALLEMEHTSAGNWRVTTTRSFSSTSPTD